MSEENNNNKYKTIGTIRENEHKGSVYYRLVLDKEFLDNAGELTQKAYLDKNGNRHFYLFENNNEKRPKWIKYDVLVKNEQ
jgi:hypothetical protein